MKAEFKLDGQEVTNLADQLQAVGIRSICPTEITAYKAEQIRLNPSNLLGRVLHFFGARSAHTFGVIGDKLEGLTVYFVAASLAVTVLSGISAIIALATVWVSIWTLYFTVGFFAAGIVTALGLIYMTSSHRITGPATWRRNCLGNEETMEAVLMPKRGRELIFTINTLWPELRIEIDELIQNETVIDPIVWVVKPSTGEEVAIFVWDDLGQEVHL